MKSVTNNALIKTQHHTYADANTRLEARPEGAMPFDPSGQ